MIPPLKSMSTMIVETKGGMPSPEYFDALREDIQTLCKNIEESDEDKKVLNKQIRDQQLTQDALSNRLKKAADEVAESKRIAHDLKVEGRIIQRVIETILDKLINQGR